MNELVVYKGRTNIVGVSLGIDVSGDTFTSEIRLDPNRESTLIATWVVTPLTDGSDGELLLTLDDSASAVIEHRTGYMDLKRVTGSEPLPVFEKPLPVIFRETVTV